MISVIAKLKVQEGKLDELMVYVRELIFETLKEPGCLEYDLHKHTENKGVFAFFEKWETMADLDSHLNSEHFTTLIPKIVECCEGDPEIDVFKSQK